MNNQVCHIINDMFIQTNDEHHDMLNITRSHFKLKMLKMNQFYYNVEIENVVLPILFVTLPLYCKAIKSPA